MRKKIVAGNWKMNLDYNEGLSLFSEVINMVKDEITGNATAWKCVYVVANMRDTKKARKIKAHTGSLWFLELLTIIFFMNTLTGNYI